MMLKVKFTSHTILPGSEREVSIYLLAGLDRSQGVVSGQRAPAKPAAPRL